MKETEKEVIDFLVFVMRGEAVDDAIAGAGSKIKGFGGTIPAMSHRVKAAELLGRHYGLFAEREEQTRPDTVQIINNIPRGETK